ncbi:hypothetical protein FRAHR75_40142 [Frankia sp. Hr75.2]|nr:hypothetical protein FRAHR75_40142 [Frankia sp. Hr75.2]
MNSSPRNTVPAMNAPRPRPAAATRNPMPSPADTAWRASSALASSISWRISNDMSRVASATSSPSVGSRPARELSVVIGTLALPLEVGRRTPRSDPGPMPSRERARPPSRGRPVRMPCLQCDRSLRTTGGNNPKERCDPEDDSPTSRFMAHLMTHLMADDLAPSARTVGRCRRTQPG